MKHFLLLFLATNLYAFQESDVGRQFLALQTKSGRGIVEGQLYTITAIVNPEQASHTGGGSGIRTGSMGIQWEWWQGGEFIIGQTITIIEEQLNLPVGTTGTVTQQYGNPWSQIDILYENGETGAMLSSQENNQFVFGTQVPDQDDDTTDSDEDGTSDSTDDNYDNDSHTPSDNTDSTTGTGTGSGDQDNDVPTLEAILAKLNDLDHDNDNSLLSSILSELQYQTANEQAQPTITPTPAPDLTDLDFNQDSSGAIFSPNPLSGITPSGSLPQSSFSIGNHQFEINLNDPKFDTLFTIGALGVTALFVYFSALSTFRLSSTLLSS